MKALMKIGPEPENMEIREIEEPTPGPNEVIIEVKASGICGTDIHIYHGKIAIPMEFPVVIGHEFSGLIAEIGKNVIACKKGDRVTSETGFEVCGKCRYCQTGNFNLCLGRSAIGYRRNGAFAKYVLVPERCVHKLPDNVDFVSAALCEPLACCVHAVNELTTVSPGDLVVISGPGQIGILSAQVAKCEGATVVLCGTSDYRLKMGKKLGADYAVNVEKEDLDHLVKELTGGYGADVFLECAGGEKYLKQALDLVCKGGQVTQVGFMGSTVSQLDVDKILYKEITLKGSFGQKWTAWDRGLKLLAQQKVQTAGLVTNRFPLAQWKEAFDEVEMRKSLKILLDPEV